MILLAIRRARAIGVLVVAAVLAALVSVVVARTARAQASSGQAPAGQAVSYLYLRPNGDTLAVETVTTRAASVDGVLAMKGQPRIEWSVARNGQTPGILSLKLFAPGAAVDATPVQSGTVDVRGDTAFVDLGTATQRAKQSIPTKAGALPLINASVLQAALLSRYARNRQLSTFNVFLTSGAQTLPVTLAQVGDTLVFKLATSEMRILSAADGTPTSVGLPGQGVRVVRATSVISAANTAASTAPVKHNYDAPAGAPYTAEQVRIPSGRGYDLAATLTRPKGATKPGVLITISGSGPQERDSEISIVKGYAIFREIADTLGRRGIAVLRWDDRGVGESGGRESAAKGTSADVAEDVRTLITWLRGHPDLDGTRIALAGHSEGGTVAPMVAANDNTLKGIALLAGTAYTGREIMLYQNKQAISAAKLTQKQKDSVFASVPAQLDSLGRVNPWVQFFMTHDPISTAKLVRVPVLVLQGMTDRQVSPEQAPMLVKAVKSNGNTDVVLRTFPNVNHLFLNDPSGSPDGYPALKNTKVNRAVLGALTEWAVRVLK
jgi:dienelactone hydrolase